MLVVVLLGVYGL